MPSSNPQGAKHINLMSGIATYSGNNVSGICVLEKKSTWVTNWKPISKCKKDWKHKNSRALRLGRHHMSSRCYFDTGQAPKEDKMGKLKEGLKVPGQWVWDRAKESVLTVNPHNRYNHTQNFKHHPKKSCIRNCNKTDLQLKHPRPPDW